MTDKELTAKTKGTSDSGKKLPDRRLRFYDYEASYAHYAERILKLRQAKIQGIAGTGSCHRLFLTSIGRPAASGSCRNLSRKIRRHRAAGAADYSAARPHIGNPDFWRPCRRDSVRPGYFAAMRTEFVCLQIFCGGANEFHSPRRIYTRGFPFLFGTLPEKGKQEEGKPESGYISLIPRWCRTV